MTIEERLRIEQDKLETCSILCEQAQIAYDNAFETLKLQRRKVMAIRQEIIAEENHANHR